MKGSRRNKKKQEIGGKEKEEENRMREERETVKKQHNENRKTIRLTTTDVGDEETDEMAAHLALMGQLGKMKQMKKKDEVVQKDVVEDVKENLKGARLTDEEIEEVINEGLLVYLNIDSYSTIGEPVYDVLSNTLPLPIEKKFAILGHLKRNSKGTLFFVVPDELALQTRYYNAKKEKLVFCKKVEPEFINEDNRIFFVPGKDFVKGTCSVLQKKAFKLINSPLSNDSSANE